MQLTWRLRFVDSFNELKRDKKITQKQLAKKIGVSQPTIAQWLSGERSPKCLEHYIALAEAVGMSPSFMLFGVVHIDPESIALAREIQRLDTGRREVLYGVLRGFKSATANPITPMEKRTGRDRRKDSQAREPSKTALDKI